MLTTLRKLGNSQGVIIPKPLLQQVGLQDGVLMSVENGAVVLRPLPAAPREGWASACQALAQAEEAPAWPDLGTEQDQDLKW